MYEYNARVEKCIDGDTLSILIDLGFSTFRSEHIRLLGVNCPESYGKDACEEGRAAKAWMTDICRPGLLLRVKTVKDKKEKYGRTLAVIWIIQPDGNLYEKSVNDQLLEAGHAKPYDGHGPR